MLHGAMVGRGRRADRQAVACLFGARINENESHSRCAVNGGRPMCARNLFSTKCAERRPSPVARRRNRVIFRERTETAYKKLRSSRCALNVDSQRGENANDNRKKKSCRLKLESLTSAATVAAAVAL